jgi:ABC-2 type transport system permease protein
MLKEFFKFELEFQLRQPLLWACALLMAFMAFGATTSDAIVVGGSIGNINRNAPGVVTMMLGVFSLLSMFFVTIFIAGSVLRDNELGMSDMLFATPMRKHDYLVGRFAAGLVACLIIFILIAIGMMLGPLMPWVDAQHVGPFPGRAYLWGMAVIVLPNLLFIGAFLMLLAATTRSMMMVYVGVIAFFVLWVVGGVFARDINNEWFTVLVDPFGSRALGRMTRYFSSAETNTILPPFSGFILANRALWSGVALLMFGATLALFKPQRAGTGKRLFGKAKVQKPDAPAVIRSELPRIVPRFGKSTSWTQSWHILCFDAAGVFRSVPFLIMLLISVVLLIAGSIEVRSMFGTTVYPRTYLMLDLISGSFNFLLLIVLVFYSGELIFKERQVKIGDVHDAMPVKDSAPLLAKSLALMGVIIGFLSAGALTAMIIQLAKGGAPVEALLYVKGTLLAALPFVLMGLCSVAV